MKAKSKIFAVILAAIAALAVGFAAVGLTGCGGAEINISGSTSIEPLMKKLIAAYNEEHPDVTINVQGGGSGVGVSDAQKGNVDFGMTSRELKCSETGVTAAKIADDGIALIVHKDSAVVNVTAEEVYNMYASLTPVQGVITTAIGREAGSGTRGAFDELVKNAEGETLGELADGYAKEIVIQNNTDGLKSGIAGNAAAIGYISMGAVDSSVKALSFEGVAATTANVGNKTYALSRPFNLVIPAAGLNADAQSFVDFILSAAGQKIVEDDGYIKLAA